MIRNLKVLGLALVAVFALASSAASAANGKLTSDGPVTLTGTETGAVTANQLTAFGSNVRCPGSTYSGHKLNQPNGFLTSGEEVATITPHYTDTACTATALNLPATVDMNGCDYVFHLGATVAGKTDTYSILATVTNCTSHIKVTVFNAARTATVCTITVTENAAGYSGLEAVDTTNGEIDIIGSISKKISVDEEGTLCGTHSEAEASLAQDVTVVGHNEAGEPTTIGISHT